MKKIFLFSLIFTIFIVKNTYSIENKILFKVDNNIITSIDVMDEIKYLKTINIKINSLNNNQIFEIAKNSLIRDKIKKIKLMKIIKSTTIEEEYLENMVKKIYLNNGFQNKEEFKLHLKNNGIQYSYILNKLSINALWNKIIYDKFFNKVVINEDQIKNEILEKKDLIIQYNLSEIVFDLKNNEKLNQKYSLIKKNIDEFNFENAALRFGISASSVQGGNIGWISENSLNKKILKEINRIDINEYTKPMVVPGGFIIIKLNNIKKEKKKINLNEEIEKVVVFKTNEQLAIFSNIYLKKIMKDHKIEYF